MYDVDSGRHQNAMHTARWVKKRKLKPVNVKDKSQQYSILLRECYKVTDSKSKVKSQWATIKPSASNCRPTVCEYVGVRAKIQIIIDVHITTDWYVKINTAGQRRTRIDDFVHINNYHHYQHNNNNKSNNRRARAGIHTHVRTHRWIRRWNKT